MGTWGTGTFENDEALDWASGLETATGPGLLRSSLAAVTDSAGYLDAPTSANALAAAEVLAALRGRPASKLPEAVAHWVTANAKLPTRGLSTVAVAAVDRILHESELKNLWADTDQAHAWEGVVQDLRERLIARSRKQPAGAPATIALRARVGDVIEIPTPSGLGYAQLTHKHDQFGHLIRVLPGLHPHRPMDLAAIVRGPSAFVILFILAAELRRKSVTIIDNLPVPDHSQAFPLFRCGTPDLTTKKVKTWWLWDGQESWPVGTLSSEQRRMPIRVIVGYESLVQKIVSDWSPERDPM